MAGKSGITMLKRILELRRWGDLIRNMVLRNLRVRYKGSALGFLWTMLSSLFMMLIYFVFLRLLKIRIELPELLTGILAWSFFSTCLSDSVAAITASPSLIKRTAFPKLVFPVSMIAANLINFLLSLAVLVLFIAGYAVFTGYVVGAGWALLALPAVVGLNLLLLFGLCNFFSCLNVYFRDMEHLMGILLLSWFFLTPVMYPIEKVTESRSGDLLLNLYCLNPMVPVVTLYRWVFLGKIPPLVAGFWISIGITLLLALGGTAFFLKREPLFADEM